MTCLFPPGSVALVTGGSRGIGRAAVLDFAGHGVDVAFCYRTDEVAAKDVCEEALACGVRTVAVRGDVSNRDDVNRIFADVTDSLGPVSILVNNAGIRRDRSAVMMRLVDWDDVLQVNLTGSFLMAKKALRSMCRQRRGVIINIASVSGMRGLQGQASYSAAKAGLVGLTRVLAREAGRYGVRVNAISPGLIRTDMTVDASEFDSDLIPLRRSGEPEDVGHAVVFLASNLASYITGAHLVIDGGLFI